MKKQFLKIKPTYPLLFSAVLASVVGAQVFGQTAAAPDKNVPASFNNLKISGTATGKLTLSNGDYLKPTGTNNTLAVKDSNDKDVALGAGAANANNGPDATLSQSVYFGTDTAGTGLGLFAGTLSSDYPLKVGSTFNVDAFNAKGNVSDLGTSSMKGLNLSGNLTSTAGSNSFASGFAVGSVNLNSDSTGLLIGSDTNVQGAITANSVGSNYSSGWSAKGFTETASCDAGTVVRYCNYGMDAGSTLDSVIADTNANSCTGTVTTGKITVAAYCFDPNGKKTGNFSAPDLLGDQSVPPSLNYQTGAHNVVVNNPITVAPIQFDPGLKVDGTAATVQSCTISPALPAGMNIDNSSCVISGTPTKDNSNVPQGLYSATLMNSDGVQAFGNVYIKVLASDQTTNPQVDYASKVVGYVNIPLTITPTTLTAGTFWDGTSASIQNCSVSNTTPLPAGLSIDPQTCVISGTPTVSNGFGYVGYLVDLTNTNIVSNTASGTAYINVRPNLAAPPTLQYPDTSSTPIKAYIGTNYSSGVVSPYSMSAGMNYDGTYNNVLSCTVSPALPAGLSMDNSCTVKGTPVASSNGVVKYTATLTNDSNLTVQASFNLNVKADQTSLPSVSYAPPNGKITGFKGVAMNSLMGGNAIINPGTDRDGNAYQASSCTIYYNLPAGLSIDQYCNILGTPTALSALNGYTVTLTNSIGKIAQTFVNLQVINPPALKEDQGVTPSITYANNAFYTFESNLPSGVQGTLNFTGSCSGTSVKNGALMPTGPYLILLSDPSGNLLKDGKYGLGSAAPCSITLTSLGYVSSPLNVSAFTIIPTPPTVTASAGDTVVNLNWTQVTDPAVTSIAVFRKDKGVTPIATLSSSATSYSDTTVIDGNTYQYYVRLIAGTLTSDSNPVSANPMANLVYSKSPANAYYKTAFSDTLNKVPTGLISCGIAPALPAGLTFGSSDCSIGGQLSTKPFAPSVSTYTITAKNSNAIVMGIVKLTIQIADGVSYNNFATQPTKIVQNLGQSFSLPLTDPSPYSSAFPGSPSCTYSALGGTGTPLPTGISLDPASCVLSGTPTQSILNDYFVSLTGANGYNYSTHITISVPFATTITLVPYKASVNQTLAASNGFNNYYSAWNRPTQPTRLFATLNFGSAVTNFPTTAAALNTALGLDTTKIKTVDPITSSNGGKTYTFWLQPVSTSGVLTFTVPANTFWDATNNKNMVANQNINYGVCAPNDEQDTYCGAPSVFFYKLRKCTGTWAWGAYTTPSCVTQVNPAGNNFVP